MDGSDDCTTMRMYFTPLKMANSTLYIFYLNFKNQWSKSDYYPHFTDEQVEAQKGRGRVRAQRPAENTHPS